MRGDLTVLPASVLGEQPDMFLADLAELVSMRPVGLPAFLSHAGRRSKPAHRTELALDVLNPAKMALSL
jgi:hypothetical protein